MADILIRGLSDAAVAHIDAAAVASGLSRQEYLRRRFESERTVALGPNRLTLNDLQRAADAVSDLDDPAIMEQAWR